jgi:hypothetical protein
MKTKNRYVTFYSPGTLFSESTRVKITARDTIKSIAKRAAKIKERYGATPYAFDIETVSEGSVKVGGKKYRADPKMLARTGMHFLTGKVLTLKDIPDTQEFNILRSNMKCNGWKAVVENTNSYRATLPFEKEDVVVDWDGKIVARGSDFY